MKPTKTHLWCSRCNANHPVTSTSLGNSYSASAGKIEKWAGGKLVGYECMVYARCPAVDRPGDESLLGYSDLR